MKLFNNLTKVLEDFPQQETVTVYSCGPTVYDYAHIGNMRTFLFEDLLIRALLKHGYHVCHVRNITDVDDKIIERASSQNISLKEFTDKYTQIFFQNLKELNFLEKHTTYLKATDHIDPMIKLIQELVDKGFAYEAEEGVYFKIQSYNDYGNFAGLDLEHIQTTAEDEFHKEAVNDFVLWKKYKPQDNNIYWDSPWGRGRPGWHTECAAMVKEKFPTGLDIHTGGIDLLFPHHTNEKAHCECLENKPMAKFWLHATHLLVDNKKMSKSIGNFYTIKDLQNQGFSNKAIRFYLQTGAHYQTPLNFTLDGLKGAETALKRIDNFIQDLLEKPSEGIQFPLKQRFMEKIWDNLNISGALGELFSLINKYYNGLSVNTENILNDMQEINDILGVLTMESKTILNPEIQAILDQREIARQNKNWAESDRLRDELLTLGVEIRDTKEGLSIRKI